jgi:transcription elongation factor GreA
MTCTAWSPLVGRRHRRGRDHALSLFFAQDLLVDGAFRATYTYRAEDWNRNGRNPGEIHTVLGLLNFKSKIEAELKGLERELRVDLPKEIKIALAMGDLRENAEYHAALERQSFVKARIAQLKNRMAELSNINLDEIPTGKIGLGSLAKVMDLDDDKELTYEFVLPEEADPAVGKISLQSPLGRGFSGKEEGDEVSIQVPSGRRNYEILSIRTIHERS